MSGANKSVERRFPALTGLRGFAALWVLTYHAWFLAGPKALSLTVPFLGTTYLHPLISIGWAGVQIFFVLSAFLLSLPIANATYETNLHDANPRRFFAKRLVRVFPAYYAQIVILLGIAALMDQPTLPEGLQWVHILTMNFMPEPFGDPSLNSINGVWWTLPVELSFYLILPALGPLALGKRRWTIFLWLMIIMLIWRYCVIAFAQDDRNISWLWFSQLPGSLDSFAIGIMCAYLFVNYQNSAAPLRNLVLKNAVPMISGAAFMIITLIYWMDANYLAYRTNHLISYAWTPLFSACIAVFVFFAAAEQRTVNVLFGNRAMFHLGIVSYGVYLWHLPVAKWFGSMSFALQDDTYLFPHYLVIMIVGATSLAAISWMLIEKPCIQSVRARFKEKGGF